MKAIGLLVCALLVVAAPGAFAVDKEIIEIIPVPVEPPQNLNPGEPQIPMNQTCLVGNLDPPAWAITGWLWGNEVYKVYCDPAHCGCAQVQPLEISMLLYAVGGIGGCGAFQMAVDVEEADVVGGCPLPSETQLCASFVYSVSFPGPGLYTVTLPLEACDPIAEPFFVSWWFLNDGGCLPGPLTVVTDDYPEVCNSYNNWGYGWYDLVLDVGFPGKISMYAEVQCADFMTATVDVDPNTLNLKSMGNFATTYIELPEGYDPADIDVSTVLFEGVIPAYPSPTGLGDYDNDGTPDLMVKFSRPGIIALLGGGGGSKAWVEERGEGDVPLEHGTDFEVTVSGQLNDGTPFSGTDVIRVIDPSGESDGVAGLEVYPSPVTTTARISYGLAAGGIVSLRIYDAAGRLVRTLMSEYKDAGTYELTWDRRNDDGRLVGAGMYFIFMNQQGKSKMQKLLVVQ